MGTNHDDSEDWKTYRRVVMNTMDRLVTKVEHLEAELIALKIKISVFSALWGIVGTVGTHLIMKHLEGK